MPQGAIEAHDVKTRQAGRVTFIEFHLVVPGSMTVACFARHVRPHRARAQAGRRRRRGAYSRRARGRSQARGRRPGGIGRLTSSASGVARLGGGKAASSARRSSLSSVTSSALMLARTCSNRVALGIVIMPGMPHHPRQCDGRWFYPMLVGNFFQRRLCEQFTLPERRIGHHHHACCASLIQQLPFDAAASPGDRGLD